MTKTYPKTMGAATLDDVVYYLEAKLGAEIGSVLPETPKANGTYTLQCVKSNTGATLSWVSAAAAETPAGT